MRSRCGHDAVTMQACRCRGGEGGGCHAGRSRGRLLGGHCAEHPGMHRDSLSAVYTSLRLSRCIPGWYTLSASRLQLQLQLDHSCPCYSSGLTAVATGMHRDSLSAPPPVAGRPPATGPGPCVRVREHTVFPYSRVGRRRFGPSPAGHGMAGRAGRSTASRAVAAPDTRALGLLALALSARALLVARADQGGACACTRGRAGDGGAAGGGGGGVRVH